MFPIFEKHCTDLWRHISFIFNNRQTNDVTFRSATERRSVRQWLLIFCLLYLTVINWKI